MITLVVHMLKGADLHAGDELILVGRGNPASTVKLHAMRADLLDAFDAGIVTLEVCPSLESLGSVDVCDGRRRYNRPEHENVAPIWQAETFALSRCHPSFVEASDIPTITSSSLGLKLG